MRAAVEVRSKRHAVVVDLAQVLQREDLKAAGVGQQRPVPLHEVMQPAHPRDEFIAGAQVEMIGVGQDERRAEFFQIARRHTLHGRRRADGREDGRGNIAVRGVEHSGAGAAHLSEFFVGEDFIGHG